MLGQCIRLNQVTGVQRHAEVTSQVCVDSGRSREASSGVGAQVDHSSRARLDDSDDEAGVGCVKR